VKTITIGRKYIGLIVLCLVAVVVLLAIIKAPAIKRQLNSWKLLPQPERLTELYYENNAKLPTTYTPGSMQQFSFTVHNLEYRTTTYSFQTIEQSGDGTQSHLLASGSFSLAQNKYKTIPAPIYPIDLGTRVEIITSLHISGDTNNETIHYYVTRLSGESP
jgi:hypothetical protein